jgi:ubiquinone/menaquinone biosynthesis C-methylase UbiE
MHNESVTEDRAGYANMASNLWSPNLSEAEREHLARLLEAQTLDPFLRIVARRSLELLRIGPGASVLDVGCGTGVLLPALAELVGSGGKVVGLDYSPELLVNARERVRQAGCEAVVELVEGNAVDLPFDDGAFDAAHVERVLIHVPDADAAIREMRRVVRPGGWVVAAEPDNAGVRVDHPDDPEGMALLTAFQMNQMTNPAMGLELYRRFATGGLVEREIVPMADFDDLYDESAAAVDRKTGAGAVAQGLMTAERLDALVSYLLEASGRGEYAWFGSMIIAAGRVPAGDG